MLADMSEDDQWYYRPSDHSVRQGKEAPVLDRMGPYPTREAAERALQIAKERNEAADAADRAWND